jgi:hypothetical protein
MPQTDGKKPLPRPVNIIRPLVVHTERRPSFTPNVAHRSHRTSLVVHIKRRPSFTPNVACLAGPLLSDETIRPADRLPTFRPATGPDQPSSRDQTEHLKDENGCFFKKHYICAVQI